MVLPGIIKKRFSSYEAYAGKGIEEIFTSDELKGASVRKANLLASVYLEN